ncbi:hypothetical protein E2C01_061769 [Portunus trituberculatus]|uniref:Uncharacterized protein n=1 Tax=Portunus trituberculatus TaxID=210409 RepID=A0A5B7H914_PORTR|nr:hypothetical protein [Portunus trituberculatus]
MLHLHYFKRFYLNLQEIFKVFFFYGSRGRRFLHY